MERKYKEEKITAIKQVREKADKSKIMILTDHNGLTVAQMTALRNKLFAVQAHYCLLYTSDAADE